MACQQRACYHNPMDFGPIAEHQIDELSAFLRATFQAGPDWPPFQPNVLRWKCIAPHPLWNGSRGYVFRRAGEIVASGTVMPCVFRGAWGELRSACIVDWAANRNVPGGGVLIYKEILSLTESLIGVGGSDDAQRVLPRIGFRSHQTMTTWSHIARPFARFFAETHKTWKSPLRLGRNLAHKFRPWPDAKGWTAQRIPRFDAVIEPVLPNPAIQANTVCVRSAAMLNYFLDCPAAAMEAYLLQRDGKVQGYFIVSRVRTNARIADLWVQSADPADYAAALSQALRHASSHGGAVEAMAGNSSKIAAEAAARAGFTVSGRQPVYLKDPRKRAPVEADLAVGLMETDAFYL